MQTPEDARRRWFGAMFLTIAGALLIWGQTLLKPYLEGALFILYWLACFALTGLALLVALLDIRATRKRTEAAHRDLFNDTFSTRKKSRAPVGDEPESTRPFTE